MNNKVIARVELRSDGVYLIIDREFFTEINTNQINALIESYGIQEVDAVALAEIYTSEESHIEAKISANTNIRQEPEKVEITVSKNKMEAHITFIEPVNGGEGLTPAGLKGEIDRSGVNFGIMEDVVKNLGGVREFGKPYLFASGLNYLSGKDAYHDYNFDTKKKVPKPKVLEDGTVDFRALNLIEMAKKDQLLVTIVPEVQGTDGINVLSEIIPCPKSKPAVPIPVTKNTYLSGDGMKLYATTPGQILFDGRKVTINPVFEVAGDVNNSTGNIEFTGSVVVKGNVVAGFKVVAEGDIDITGVVESSYIKAKGNVLISRGVQGADKAEIIADGDVSLKFAENCTIRAGRNVNAEAVLHSKVTCRGNLELAGKSGYLVGGEAYVQGRVFAKTIGSAMGTATNIQVGLDPEAYEEYREYIKEYNTLKSEYDKVDSAAKSMKALNERNALTDKNKNIFLKLLHQQAHLRDQLLKLKATLERLSGSLDSDSGTIVATGSIRSGVKVTIGNAKMHIRDDIKSCVLKNVDSAVTINPYIP
ncbi:MAG: FapA family protein [Defluviitaleaceae bacterium]|nr:FapA family protein [Defluviitaleaceae bacterium]